MFLTRGSKRRVYLLFISLVLLGAIYFFTSGNLTTQLPSVALSTEDVAEANYQVLTDLLNQKISEPKVPNLVRAGASDYERANATLLILARTSDLKSIIHTMKQIETTFNSKFNYPYVFLNDKQFSENFKKKIRLQTKAEIFFETIDPEVWNQPAWIDEVKQYNNMQALVRDNIAYANKKSYHNMCRYYSSQFYNHPRLQQFKYYWRFEPGTDYFCQIDYDVFRFMQDNDKIYGFNIALYDSEQTVKSLWVETEKFIESHSDYISSDPALNFLQESKQHPEKTQYTSGYSTCHFWSNFEIADMDFYRSEPYTNWIEHLESTGGFYYERWGDAPVHSIGVSLFARRDQIHWFRDIGYMHHPYANTPNSDKCKYKQGKRNENGPGTGPAKFTYDHLKDQNCLAEWWRGMSKSQKAMY